MFYVNISKSIDIKEVKNKAFTNMFILNTFQLIFETLTCIIDGQKYIWIVLLRIVIHSMIFIILPLIAYQWYVFVDLWINGYKNHSLKRKTLFLVPIIINIIIVFISQFFKLVFYIDNNGVYHRGMIFYVPVIITYIYLIYSFRMIYASKGKLNRREFIPLLIFGVVPTIASLFQDMFYGLLVIWSSVTFSLIILYLYLQQHMMFIDYLTGAWTREKFLNYLNSRIKDKKSGGFSIAFIDLNDFKIINDTFGHNEGDKALIKVASIIKQTLRTDDSITRYGGDEFVLFINADTEQEVKEVIGQIYKAIEDYNNSSKVPYNLEISSGYALYNFDDSMTADEYINHVDKLMYLDKKSKKNNVTI
jgi:diguanylate cyclase (GGDEF)-like protein